jgi:hypothetical protein
MDANLSDVPVLAKLPEAARCLRLSERKVWEMGDTGVIGVERFGRAVRYRVREFIRRLRGDDGQRGE